MKNKTKARVKVSKRVVDREGREMLVFLLERSLVQPSAARCAVYRTMARMVAPSPLSTILNMAADSLGSVDDAIGQMVAHLKAEIKPRKKGNGNNGTNKTNRRMK
jgi:hypothetical protein